MSKRIPIRLNKEPLLEAVWEIRFASDGERVSFLFALYQRLTNLAVIT